MAKRIPASAAKRRVSSRRRVRLVNTSMNSKPVSLATPSSRRKSGCSCGSPPIELHQAAAERVGLAHDGLVLCRRQHVAVPAPDGTPYSNERTASCSGSSAPPTGNRVSRRSPRPPSGERQPDQSGRARLADQQPGILLIECPAIDEVFQLPLTAHSEAFVLDHPWNRGRCTMSPQLPVSYSAPVTRTRADSR